MHISKICPMVPRGMHLERFLWSLLIILIEKLRLEERIRKHFYLILKILFKKMRGIFDLTQESFLWCTEFSQSEINKISQDFSDRVHWSPESAPKYLQNILNLIVILLRLEILRIMQRSHEYSICVRIGSSVIFARSEEHTSEL